jgi:hypothetical protein
MDNALHYSSAAMTMHEMEVCSGSDLNSNSAHPNMRALKMIEGWHGETWFRAFWLCTFVTVCNTINHVASFEIYTAES